MFIGIAATLVAGAMLGLYALPGKYTTDFEEENKWSLFFVLTMFVVPLVATFCTTEIFRAMVVVAKAKHESTIATLFESILYLCIDAVVRHRPNCMARLG